MTKSLNTAKMKVKLCKKVVANMKRDQRIMTKKRRECATMFKTEIFHITKS